MELGQLIELGYGVTKSHTDLANLLGVARNSLTDAKAGRRGLPSFACFRLADLIGIDAKAVIAASELVTEKNPEKRAVFAPFVMGNAEHALSRIAANAVKAVHRASSLT